LSILNNGKLAGDSPGHSCENRGGGRMWCGECRLLVILGKLTSPRWKRLEDRGVMIPSISLSFFLTISTLHTFHT
jgi:hypothetical protein